MPTPFVADAADEAVRSNSILNERKAADIIEETALEVDIRAWRAEGLRLLQAASAREDHVPNGARRPCYVAGAVRCLVLRLRRRWDIALVLGRTVLTGAGPSAVRDGRQGPDGADAVRGRHRSVSAVERARSRCDARAALAVALSAHPH